jgi:hypothetical protein
MTAPQKKVRAIRAESDDPPKQDHNHTYIVTSRVSSVSVSIGCQIGIGSARKDTHPDTIAKEWFARMKKEVAAA